jgi:hypothetical protein
MHKRDEVEVLRCELERERERAERAEMVLAVIMAVIDSSTWNVQRHTQPAMLQ